LRNDFVNWDDGPYAYQNAKLREWSWAALASHFVTRDAAGGWTLPTMMGNYHPLTMVSLHVDYHFSKRDRTLNPQRETELHAILFHTTSAVLHIANTLLVFLFVLRLLLLMPRSKDGQRASDGSRVAFVAALLFGINTLHVESVAWISERKDVLYTFFFFLSLLAWLEHMTTGARRWYIAALAAFLLSLLSKGQAVTLPLALPVVDLLARRPLWGRALVEKIPFFALALAFGLLAIRTQGEVLFVADAFQPLWLRPLFAAYGFVHYIVRLFVPIDLLAHYTYAQALGRPLLLYVMCPALAVVIAVGLFRLCRRDFLLAFGLLFFVLNIAPMLQLLPVGTAVMADRYTYVASAGVFLASALVLDRLIYRRSAWKNWIAGAFVAYAVLIGIVTRARVSVWRNSETLWTEELRHNPRSARAHNNLGIAPRNTANPAEAERHFRAAIEIDPQNDEAWNNLGVALKRQGRGQEAVTFFERALAGNPLSALSRTNFGDTLSELGQLEAAAAQYREALRLQPRYHVARGGLIEALRRMDRLDDAQAECRAGLALEPGSARYGEELAKVASAWNGRGVEARRHGAHDEAEGHFRRALQIDTMNAMAHGNLGALLASRGREEEAAPHLREAARLEPDDPEHLRALAWFLATARQAVPRAPGEARGIARRAVALTRGEDALSLYSLGLVEEMEGDPREVLPAFERAAAAAKAAGNAGLADDLRRQIAARSRR
jgi:tetratricopeptide (TPR) repeat protein